MMNEPQPARESSMNGQTQRLHKIASAMQEQIEQLRQNMHPVLRPDQQVPSDSVPMNRSADIPEPHCPLYDELSIIADRFYNLSCRITDILSYLEM